MTPPLKKKKKTFRKLINFHHFIKVSVPGTGDTAVGWGEAPALNDLIFYLEETDNT